MYVVLELWRLDGYGLELLVWEGRVWLHEAACVGCMDGCGNTKLLVWDVWTGVVTRSCLCGLHVALIEASAHSWVSRHCWTLGQTL